MVSIHGGLEYNELDRIRGQAVHDERRAEDTQPNKSRDKLGPLAEYGRYLISD